MLLVAGPWLGLWLVSPLVAWWLSRTLPGTIRPPFRIATGFSAQAFPANLAILRGLCHGRRKLAAAGQLQEKPLDGIASRTSPTNIGIALLADLAACDFGYCSTGRLLDRIRKTFSTLARMERHRGHFYNWYDTRSLKPLLPLYVSTVDSGNMAGHLLVLRSGLLELQTKLLRAAHLLASKTLRTFSLTSPVVFTARSRKRSHRWCQPMCCRKFTGWQTTWRTDPTRLSASMTTFLQRLAT